MTYDLVLTITQKWRLSVDADSYEEAAIKAEVLYEGCPNPWDDEQFADEQPETVSVQRA